MNTLDLQAMGLEEMNQQEMQEVDGGNPFLWLIAGIVIAECLDRGAGGDFRDGWSAGGF